MSANSDRNAQLRPENSDGDPDFMARVEIVAQRVGNATKLAAAAGISRRTVGTYIAGEAEPSRPRLVAMAKVGRVRLEWLATGEGPMEPEDIEETHYPRLIPEALSAAINAVEEWLKTQHLAANSDEKTSLIMSVYNLRIKERP